jgi:acyl dehydratase
MSETADVHDATSTTALTIDTQRVSRWAEVTDDHNPLHLDARYAANTRFRVPIVHGSLLFALACDAAQRAGNHGALTIRFLAPVPVGVTVTATARPDGVVLNCDGTLPVDVRYGTEPDPWH